MTDTLADAAALIRERAEVATPGPWVKRRGPGEHVYGEVGSNWVADTATREDMRHIASWSPAVALAVADLFDWHATHDVGGPSWRLAHAAAGAYLGAVRR